MRFWRVPESYRRRQTESRFRLLVVVLVGAIGLWYVSSKLKSPKPPNIVFILADDLGYKDLGAYGSSFYETPNLDRLAAGGLRFTNAYATCPVCSPSRASLMTGKYPARVGITDWIPGRQDWFGPAPTDKLMSLPFTLNLSPHNETTVATLLRKAGYSTYFVGKWHLGEDETTWPEYHGFDVNIAGWKAGHPWDGYFSPYHNPRLSDGPSGEYLTDRLTSEAIDLLKSHFSGLASWFTEPKPVFLWLAYYQVHIPLEAKEVDILKFRNKAERMFPAHQDGSDLRIEEHSSNFIHEEWMKRAPYADPPFRVRVQQNHPTYAAMVHSLDWNIGRLDAALQQLGLAENTVVFFMSDNGGLSTSEGSPTSNLPLRGGKGWLYEGGIREPLIIRWPNVIAPDSVCHTPVTGADVFPTLLNLANCSAGSCSSDIPRFHASNLDGMDLLPLLRTFMKSTDSQSSPSNLKYMRVLEGRSIFWHYPHYSNQGSKPGSAIRRGDMKLIHFLEDDTLELYNVTADIGELHNLATSPSMSSTARSLLRLLKLWKSRLGARGMVPNPNYDPLYKPSRNGTFVSGTCAGKNNKKCI